MKTLISRTDAIEGVVDEAPNPEIMGQDAVSHETMTSSARPPFPTRPEASRRMPPAVVMLSGRNFLFGCAVVAGMILLVGRVAGPSHLAAGGGSAGHYPGLFLFGSFKYQIHKNALTYGMLLIIVATFCGLRTSEWHVEIAQRGWWPWTQHICFRFADWTNSIHADTMLFILGLTFFVSVIAQTRLLEGLTFSLLRRNRGEILSTVIAVTAVVAFASGVLDGVSMIGLTIRTLVIILLLAAAPMADIRYAVMVCTTVTTVCGIWLAYGEPPNLIMKANLVSSPGKRLFSLYCAPDRGRDAIWLSPGTFERDCVAARSISTRWMSSTPMPRTCDFFRPPATARWSRRSNSSKTMPRNWAAGPNCAAASARRRFSGPRPGPGTGTEADPQELLGHLVSEDLADVARPSLHS